MSEKRKEFLERIKRENEEAHKHFEKIANLEDRGNIFISARVESERICSIKEDEREKI